MVQNPNCDAGTALMIFWRCDPEHHYKTWADPKALDQWEQALFHVMETACEIVKLKSRQSTIAYCPDRNPVAPQVQASWARSIPTHMYEPVVGSIDSKLLLDERKGAVPFHDAAASGDLETLKRELASGIDVHLLDRHHDGSTALEEACAAGHGDAVDLLLDAGAASTKRWQQRAWDRAIKPSSAASADDKMRILSRLLEFVNIDRVLYTRTGLGWAAARGDTPLMRFFLEHGARLDAKGGGLTPLMCAARFGQTGAARLLLEAGADIATVDKNGKQALHHAVDFPGWHQHDTINRAEVVEYLVSAGADIFAETSEGHTSLTLFFSNGPPPPLEATVVPKILGARPPEESLVRAIVAADEQRLRTLLEAGADPNVPDGADEPLRVAVCSGLPSLVELLLKHGATPKLRSGVSGESLIHAALTGESVDASMLSLLLDAGIDIDLPDRHGSSALHHVVASEDKVRILLARGAKPNERGEHGETALHRAALGGHVESARLLIDGGWSVALPDDSGLTALHCAVACRHDNVCSMLDVLLEAGADPSAIDHAGNTAWRWGHSLMRIEYRPIWIRDDYSPHAYSSRELEAIRPLPTLLVCRLSMMPAPIARALVQKSEPNLHRPPWNCLYGIATTDEEAWSRLNAEHPEPEIAEVDEGMALVDTLMGIGSVSPWIQQLLTTQISPFFYTGRSELAEQWFSDSGFRLVSFSEVFSQLTLLWVSHHDGAPVSQLRLQTKSKNVELPGVGKRHDLVLVNPATRELLAVKSRSDKLLRVPKRGAKLCTESGSVAFPIKLVPGASELVVF